MKKVYKMIDGIPLYKHLKNSSVENKMTLLANDYGEIAEVLAKKIIGYSIENKNLSDVFPGICILTVHNITSKRHHMKHGDHTGDAVFEITYKENDKYGKKILIFEVKYGISPITQGQITKYCNIIDKPGEYFPKADEAKIIYIFFGEINTVKDFALYRICELDKELVSKLLQAEEDTKNCV